MREYFLVPRYDLVFVNGVVLLHSLMGTDDFDEKFGKNLILAGGYGYP